MPVFYNELIEDIKDESMLLEKVADKYCWGFEFLENIKNNI